MNIRMPLAIACIAAATLPAAATATANPASEFCARMGGRTVVAKLSDGGDIGLCELSGRKIVEEWTLFRMLKGKVPVGRNSPFR